WLPLANSLLCQSLKRSTGLGLFPSLPPVEIPRISGRSGLPCGTAKPLLLQSDFAVVWGFRCGPGRALRILRLVRTDVFSPVAFISEGSRCFPRRAHGRSNLPVPSPRASQAALPPSSEQNRTVF